MKKPEGWPFWRLAAYFSPLVTGACEWLQRIMPDTMPSLPWLEITKWLAAFVLGAIIADVTNPNSFLRRRLTWQFRFYDVLTIGPPSSFVDQVEYVLPTITLLFVRNARSASLILNIKGAILGDGRVGQSSSIVYETERTFVKGERYQLTFAHIPLKRYPTGPLPAAGFGPLGRKQPPLIGGSINALNISLACGHRSQDYKIHLRRLSDLATGGRYFCMGEDYDAFENAQGPAFT